MAYLPGSTTITAPIVGFLGEITPSDSEALAMQTRQLYIGGAGNIAVRGIDGSESIEPVAAGERVDWQVTHVLATGTTATGIRGYY